MRDNFEKKLNELFELMAKMGNLVIESIENSITALVNKDIELAKHVISGDDDIDSIEEEIESLCFSLILKEQPVASDLRYISSAIKIITDLERIGDQASDIAALIIKLNKRNYQIEDLGSIIEMAEISKSMVKDSIKSYIEADIDLIETVLKRDDEVDDLFLKVREEVVIDIKEDRFATKSSLDIFMIAKYLERIGDHTENISERVYFSLTGKQSK